ASASAATRDPQGALVDSYPLSPIQAGMLFHAVGRPVPGVDIEQVVIALAEHVEEACFMAAWERVIARHGILRSRFRWLGLDQPVQDVMDHVGLPLHAHDWRGSVAAENEQRFAALLAEDRNRGFDLNRAPLMRLTLARFADAEYRVLWTFHHALLDGRSFVTVLHEVFTLYEAALRGETAVLPAPHPYREYIDWLQGIDHDSAREHWCAALAGFRAPTPLVVARHGEALPASGVYLGNHAVALAPDLTAALDVRAGEAAVTLNNLVQAAWALLLGRYSGESDVVFGATRACRKSAMGGADDRVGLFINTLPLRVAIDPGAELGPWLRALRAQQIALRDYEHTPLARVQAWSEVPGGTPLFETLVVYEHQTLLAQLRTLGGRWATRAVEYYGQTNFPLTVAAYGGDRLLLQLQYSRVRFDDSTTERMLGHLTTLLESMARCPLNARLRDLAMVSAAERRALLSTPNAGRVFPRRLTLHEHFEQQVGRTPDSIALVCEGERLTYDALNRRANRVAHALKKVGVERGTLVGLRVERNIDMVAGILGILKCGAAYLPLDPAYPQARVEFMLRDSGASIVLTQQALAADIEGIGVTRILLDVPLEELPETNPGTRSAPDDLAYVIYTSGSTGTPKGVEITHYNVTRLFDATRDWYRFAENDVWTLFHSYAFDFSVWELWGALLHGGRVVVVPYWVSRSPEAFRELLIRERVTVLNQTPSAFRQLIRADRFVPDGAYDLRYVIFGGEALELQALRPWFERHGDARPQLVNMYGITETTVHVTYRPIGWRDIESGAGSVIGQALPDLQLYLLAPGGEPVPIGVAGEIHVGGAGVARGYRNRPDLTAERFITDSRSTGSRLYRTGDLARRLENGDIEYLGRIDDQVKIRGFRIELGEIEARIAQHPQVREACVIAREDAPGDRRLVAYVVARDAVPDLAGPLREWLRVSIPDYMVPAHFVRLDALPLTENGKVDRKALPRPDAVTPAARRHVAPRNAIERAIADIWSAVLRVPQVGVDDNFFELGGDSILSIQVIARCRAAGLNINSRDLFERPTIAQLAASAQQAVARAIDQEPAHGALPLTPIQRWFVEADFAQRDYWNQAFLFEVPPDLDLDALEAAFHELIVHHDALRLCLRHEGAEWTLEYAPVPHAERSIARFDLAGLDPDARNAVLEAHCVQAQRGLDLAEGRLVQAAHFALGAGARGRLLIVVHHLAVDGVSWRLLREDLELAYFSLKEGKRPAFPTRTSSFQRWAQRLNQYANSAAVRQSLDFWLEEGRKPVATIPQDDSSAANLERDARIVARRLNCGETDALLQQAPRAYRNHINDLLLTALAIALRRTNGGAAFRIDLEGHGREELFE
ncbi:MAG TPA: amino acid adenylation domain-containing protein, partial [Burkholderiales bacterium]|nr:amino acid adenylation domain-containing protein [Burkholderiales bacterium]